MSVDDIPNYQRLQTVGVVMTEVCVGVGCLLTLLSSVSGGLGGVGWAVVCVALN